MAYIFRRPFDYAIRSRPPLPFPLSATAWNNFSNDANCKAVWDFNNSNLPRNDVISTNHLSNGTAAPTRTTSSPLEAPASMDFEKDNGQYLEITDANLATGFPLKSTDTNKVISVVARIKMESLPSGGLHQNIFNKNDGGTNNKKCLQTMIDGTTPYARLIVGFNSGISVEGGAHATTLSAGVHYVICWSYDNSDKTWAIRIRSETGSTIGVDASGTFTLDANKLWVGDCPLVIGGNKGNWGYSYFFDGLLDEIAVFDRILTAVEVSDIAKGDFGIVDESVGDFNDKLKITVQSYCEENADNAAWLSTLYSREAGQSFEGQDCILDSIQIPLSKAGSPTGSMEIKIYAHSGTFGTSSLPDTAQLLATSDTMPASNVTNTEEPPRTIYTFTFSGANRITLQASTYYFFALSWAGGPTNADTIKFAKDQSSTTGYGNAAGSNQSNTWTLQAAQDHCHYIRGVLTSLPQTYDDLKRIGRWLYHKGAPIYLIGHDLQQLFSDAVYSVAQVKEKIDYLAAAGINCFRVWINTWFKEYTDYFPYLYTGGKFDLTQWNSTFWSRYVELTDYAKSKGIMVVVALFSEYPCTVKQDLWTNRKVYWRSAENSNGYYDDVSGDLFPQFFTLDYQPSGKPNLTTLQKGLIDKAISELGSIGNVIFQVHNEFPAVSENPATGSWVAQVYQWQQEMSDYLRNTHDVLASVHAHEFALMHLKGVEYWRDRKASDILTIHPYSVMTGDTFANINTLATLFQPLQNSGRVLMVTESHDFVTTYTDAVTREMWACFVNGIYYLAYQGNPFLTGDTAWLTRAERLKTLANIAKMGNWHLATPNKTLVKTGPGAFWEGMANAGDFYCYYFTGTPSATAVTLNLPTGSYKYRWFDTRTWAAAGIGSGTVSGGLAVSITAPSTGDWAAATGVVLVIEAIDSTPIAWGHVTNVTQTSRNFFGKWRGTGQIEGNGDSERIALESGQYMESEPAYTGTGTFEIVLNEYGAGATVTIKYRTAAALADVESASLTTFSGSITSLGYVIIRLEA